MKQTCRSCDRRSKNLNEYDICATCQAVEDNDARVWAWFRANQPERFERVTRGGCGLISDRLPVTQFEFVRQYRAMYAAGELDTRVGNREW